MRWNLLLLSLMLFSISSLWSQDSTAIDYPGFMLMRSQEDYTFLKDTPRKGWAKIKYVPLSNDNFLSFGGDIRMEHQYLMNEDWTSGNDDRPLFLRFMFHTDLRLGPNVRIFTQLKSGHAIGRNGPPMGLNVDRLDIHQLFLEIWMGNSRVELGRQELKYGSRRLISIREGTNVRQSFDGARWIFEKPNHRLDVLVFAYNPQRIGYFDNRIDTDQAIWGAYYVWNTPVEQINLDLYYLGSRNLSPRFEAGTYAETRHSFGLRHWGSWGNFRYNNELVFQVGAFNDGKIKAWTASTDLYYMIPGKVRITPGIKADLISGDESPEDDVLQTFNPLYPRGGYFGLLAVIGPANLMDLHPSIKINPDEKWMINLDWDFFWRHRLGDGIYFPSGRLNVAGSSSEERFIGHQGGIQVSRTINRFLEVEASYFYFVAGAFIKEVTEGANYSLLGTSVNFKF